MPVNVRMEIHGVQQVIRALSRLTLKLNDGVDAAMMDIAQQTLDLATYYAPVDTGLMRSTGRIEKVKVGPKFIFWKGGTEYRVVFGSSAAYYTIYVHEDLTKYHQEPTQSKFLERAVREVSNSIPTTLAKYVRFL